MVQIATVKMPLIGEKGYRWGTVLVASRRYSGSGWGCTQKGSISKPGWAEAVISDKSWFSGY